MFLQIYECVNSNISWHDFIRDKRNNPVFNSLYIRMNRFNVEYSLYPDGKCTVWYTDKCIENYGLDNKCKVQLFTGIWFKLGFKTIVLSSTK